MKNKGFLTISMIFLFSLSCCKVEESVLESTPKEPFQELFKQGIDKYLGVFKPDTSIIISAGLMEHKFSGISSPICFTGNQFSMFTRDGSSDNLLIFLQGGGFCSPTVCDALETGIPLIAVGVLSANATQNPFANYNLGYLPYCDGSGWMGDKEVDSDGDGKNDRFFRGLQNLSASLDVVVKKYPTPKKIVLAGNSAGGFGVHAALPLVRKLYPNVPIFIINDAGVGILNPGAMNELISYWGAQPFFPSSCAECIGSDGNLTDYHSYQLNEDPNILMAYISSKQDATFTPNIIGGAPVFESQLIEAANQLKSQFPNRFNALIANGEDHTFLIRRFEKPISNTTVRKWVAAMSANDNTWISVVE